MFHCIYSTSYFYLTESKDTDHINEFRLTLSPKGGNTKWDHCKETASVTVFTSGWCHFLFYFNHHSTLDLRRKWQPTPVFLPGESCGQRSLVGCCPWSRTESDTAEATRHASMHWTKKWQPTPVFLPGGFQGQMTLVGCHLWDRTESDTIEVT